MLAARTVLLVTALTAVIALLALAPSALANDAPVVTNGTVTPTSLAYLGGDVTITADVTDDTTAQPFVYVEVLRGPIHWEVALSQDGGTSIYSGTAELPANLTSDPVTWQFYVFARDNDEVEGSTLAGQAQ